MDNNIIIKDTLEQYKEDMSVYAIIVNRRRSTPEFKDGLKLVHRRILEVMYHYKHCVSEGTKCKSSAITGNVIASLHPHGDTAVYDAMKPLANWFECNMPLIEGWGNWGNFEGDGAAAQRYTEAYLSKFALDCVISDMRETNKVVDWVKAFDDETMEPEYMPVSVPLLLINGAYGIGVGMITSIPKHNFNEVIDATIKLIKDPNASVELIPDHCMPCEIIKTNFKEIGNKGEGKYVVRGIIDIEDYAGSKALVIKSTPDFVFLNTVTDKIEDLIVANKIIGIQKTEVAHIKDKNGVAKPRFIIILKKGVDPNFVRDTIYKNTQMQTTCIVRFETLNGTEPVRMSYKSYLLAFIEFRKLTKFRLYCNRVQKLLTKMHEFETYITVLRSGEINNIIKMIQKQKTVDDNELIEYLVKKLNITDMQAKFIIGSNIKKLSIGYLQKYEEEYAKYKELSDKYEQKIISDDFEQEIIDELTEYKKIYGRPRNSKVISASDASDIPNGDFKIVITENNFIKKLTMNTPIGNFKNDKPRHVLKCENIENILLFDEMGKVFKLPVHKIPLTDKNSVGTDIRFLCKNINSKIIKIVYEPAIEKLSKNVVKHFITIVTRNGIIKKIDIEDCLAVPLSGILYIKLDEADTVQDVSIVGEPLSVIVYSDSKALKIGMNEIPHLKRNTKGVKSMNTKEFIDGLSIIYPNTTDVVIITESGYINRMDVVALSSGRAKAGGSVIKLNKNDKIHSIFGVNMNDTIKIITANNKIEMPVSDIPVGSSISKGTKMISTKSDVIINALVIRNKQ